MRRFGQLIENDLAHAKELEAAFLWSAGLKAQDCTVSISTAHLCKGLEHDTVILSDDYYSIIDAFEKGKAISESDLYLMV